ncbi:MAG: MBL fold metallo-hydrolase [Bacillota bacterium]|nr:MBL fold metallo-hydrolase [Bacillota bacterium]
MEVLFMGTAAAEGIPALFCQCDICRAAAKNGGKDLRSRASCLFDNDLLVDFGPDTFMHKQQYNIDLGSIEHMIITHSHEDHFTPQELTYRRPPFGHLKEVKPLHIYGNAHVKMGYDNLYSGRQHFDPYLKFHLIRAFETFTAGAYEITPLRGLHKRDEECFVYYIKKNGKAVLYGNDSGIFPKETLDWLAGKPVDLAIYDCTMAFHKDGNNHMGIEDNVILNNELKARGCITDKTKVIITHFSHNGEGLHDQLLSKGEEFGFEPAYDGMKIEL